MNDFRLSFTLKQHTPMIHFQHDQPGATLRATELKPKLDRFLLEKEPSLPHKVHPNDDISLDYRVTIRLQGGSRKDYPMPFVAKGKRGYQAPYFADGVSIEHNGTVEIVFFTFSTPVRQAISKWFELFLTFENFGARQSKGFGGFHLASMSKSAFERLIARHPNPVYKLKKHAKGKEALKAIDEFYKHLKSGINYPHRKIYNKSLLFQYMCNRHLGWEKRRLKQVFPEIVHGSHAPIECSSSPAEYRYIRAMLGLAEINEYRPDSGKKQIRIESRTLENGQPAYQRFKSPITFKVFEDGIYLFHEHSYRELLDKPFKFRLGRQDTTINTPRSFDLSGFLAFVEKNNQLIEPIKGGA